MVSERPYQDEEWLRQKLDGNSVSEIADVAGVTDVTCIESLKEARDELGEIPTKKQYDSLDLSPSSKRVAEQFGSWAEAHREVFGYTTSGPFIEEDCYEAIRRARDQLGHEPTSQEYIDLDIPPSMTTIRKTVGSWSEAKKNALEN